MADAVRDVLQGMGVELSMLRHHKVFSDAEIPVIVRRRTDFEYRLRRKPADRADFARYIRYELALQSIRERRIERLGIKRMKIITFGGLRHLHFIFARALRKFPGDMAFWSQYIEFCMKTGAFTRLAEAMSRALSLHPLEDGLWVLAAKWEYEHNCNMGNARALMQRALRMNPGSSKLYVEYAKLELLYVEKLRTRLELAGGTPDAIKPASAARVSAPEGPDAPDTSADAFESGLAAGEANEGSNSFFRAEIPKLIYDAAVAKFPSDVDLRVQFLRLFLAFDGTEHVQRQVVESIERDFPASAKSVSAIASWTAATSGSPAACKVYERALASADAAVAEQLWESYAEHARCAASLDLNTLTAFESKTAAKAVAALCQKAHKAKQASAAIYLRWMVALAYLGDEAKCADVAKQAIRAHPASAELAAALEVVCPEAVADAPEPPKSAPAGVRADYALRQVRCKIASGAPVTEIMSLCNTACTELPRANAAVLREKAAIAVAQARPAAEARTAFDWALSWPTTAELVRECVKRRDEVGQLRAYDRALRGTALGRTDAKLWHEWMLDEQNAGRLTAAETVYRLAKSTLDNCMPFVEATASSI
eukprot:m51a1_g11925 putative U3 small nucleolar RNA-associated protein (598) ;mRNA; f:677801-679739